MQSPEVMGSMTVNPPIRWAVMPKAFRLCVQSRTQALTRRGILKWGFGDLEAPWRLARKDADSGLSSQRMMIMGRYAQIFAFGF